MRSQAQGFDLLSSSSSAVSRRAFIGGLVAGGATLLAPAVLGGEVAQAQPAPVLPFPIVGGTPIGPFGLKHFYFPTFPNPAGDSNNYVSNGTGDLSTIRDFNGVVGGVEFPPTAPVSGDPFGGMFWGADIRFIKGTYVGRDNREHRAAFAFV